MEVINNFVPLEFRRIELTPKRDPMPSLIIDGQLIKMKTNYRYLVYYEKRRYRLQRSLFSVLTILGAASPNWVHRSALAGHPKHDGNMTKYIYRLTQVVPCRIENNHCGEYRVVADVGINAKNLLENPDYRIQEIAKCLLGTANVGGSLNQPGNFNGALNVDCENHQSATGSAIKK